MTKIRFVRCDNLLLKRYYAPVLIELDLLRKMIPELPHKEEEAKRYLKKNPDLMLEFLQWYHPNDSDTVTDPKGKGRDNPQSVDIEDIEIQTEEDDSWRWLFSHFSEIEEYELVDFCEENSIEVSTFDSEESLEYEMVLIPEGEFMMGTLYEDEGAEDDEKPCHQVQITKEFYVGKYPVTQALWESVMDSNPSYFRGTNRPVESVSWFECVKFCNKLSELEGKETVYIIDGENVNCDWKANGYRLLTEAEWEYCARANQETLYSGSNNPNEVAWYSKNSGKETHPVGKKKPNGFGLYDMSGNVWEWCWDWWGDYSTENQSDPTGKSTGSYRVGRGGGWGVDPRDLRVSSRSRFGPAFRSYGLGFRLGLPR